MTTEAVAMQILLAEDDRQLRVTIARGLAEAGYRVDEAETGPAALSLATANTYDAVVLDVLLPGKSGLEVCSALRASGNKVPLLMLTALDAVQTRIAGLDAGADDYLTKPFDFGELLARLRAITRRQHPEPGTELTVGDLVIDTARHAVRRGSRVVQLTSREFALLVHLARNAGRVVGRAELMEQVWNDSPGSYSNIIDVYAGRLRRKLEKRGETPLLTTVRATGLLLEPTLSRGQRAPR
jgi:DNA-binding response OmpR family regulator